MGILEPVPVGEATEWCARMVVVAKKSGQPRRTIDYQKLNAACKRETHHTPTPFDMMHIEASTRSSYTMGPIQVLQDSNGPLCCPRRIHQTVRRGHCRDSEKV
ncbi:hypothetical protein E2C01_045246 [Portunus trituberculatus]|uniref:Uncharacterized protein n=1 Tax=Portunus trituberculatus TaxID=210409 RepID=A0A5B7FXT8_PORTR|nr:hypothetical protein [Portunus trituberculatus]